MRVLLTSWEYPPLVVGGLGRHVEALARELATAGHDVRVVTRGTAQTAADERDGAVRVRRAALDPLAIDFTTETLLAWSQAAEHSMLRAALPLVRRWRPDVVHAHDWLVAQSSLTLTELSGIPLVTTVHATEAGRGQGWLPEPLNRGIHSVERWLVQRSREVITCSTAMGSEVVGLFGVDASTVHVVPNGIDPALWRASPSARAAARARHAPVGPLIVFAGRLVHEKGVQTLLDAARGLRARHGDLRIVVAGTGPAQDALREQARRLRLGSAARFTGFVPDSELAALLGAADVAVVPSLYEPFGLVALEAAAARTPVVVSRTGGLADVAESGVAAAAVPPGDPAALGAAITGLLTDRTAAQRAVRRADRVIARDYTWRAVAERTAAVYERACAGRTALAQPSRARS